MNSSIKTSVATLAFAGVFAMLFGTLAPVSADVPMPDWNRMVVSFELFPPDASSDSWYSTSSIGLVAHVPEAEGRDGSFVLHHFVDDELVGEQIVAASVFGSSGNCDCVTCPGMDFCTNDTQLGCWCGIIITPARFNYSTRNLTPGSIVSIEIVAAPDAVEEQYTEDDRASIVVDESVSATEINWTSVKSLYR